jgi:hypothetical protein
MRFPRGAGCFAVALLLVFICCGAARGQQRDRFQASTPEGLLLTIVLAQDLAEAALEDAVAPLGSLMGQIGPSAIYAASQQGAGNWSLSLGAAGATYELTNPDYTLDDPRGADRLEGGIGAFSADLSLGLLQGYHSSGRISGLGSVDLLLRLGYTLGDQANLEEIDFSSWAPIFGGGLRFGVLRGPGLPCISLAAGVNHFTRRTYSVVGETSGRDFEVNLDFEQTSYFFLLEIGKRFGFVTPYMSAGAVRNRLVADYDAGVIYDADSEIVTVRDAIDSQQTSGLFLAGLEVGRGLIRLDLEGGVLGDSTHGKVFLRISG